MRVHRSILCSLVLAATPVVARAQALSSQLVEQINTSTMARVRLVTGSRGTLYAPRADSTSLAYDRSEFLNRGGNVVALPAPLSIGQIAEIQVANGSHANNGATIGGGVGAGLALLAVAACSSGNSYCQPSTGQAVGAVVVWTFIGAGVGALIGSNSPRWRTTYPVR